METKWTSPGVGGWGGFGEGQLDHREQEGPRPWGPERMSGVGWPSQPPSGVLHSVTWGGTQRESGPVLSGWPPEASWGTGTSWAAATGGGGRSVGGLPRR